MGSHTLEGSGSFQLQIFRLRINSGSKPKKCVLLTSSHRLMMVFVTKDVEEIIDDRSQQPSERKDSRKWRWRKREREMVRQ